MRGTAFEFDVFISHAWDPDDAGRDNHARAKRLNARLQSLGLKTWFDDERTEGLNLKRMAEGIEGSVVSLVCVTRRYMEKVSESAGNNCKFEFEYALNKRTTLNMLPVVMEASMTDTSRWNGTLGMVLGRVIYHKLTSDDDAEFDHAVTAIAAAIRKKVEKLLPNELQAAAGAASVARDRRRASWRACNKLVRLLRVSGVG